MKKNSENIIVTFIATALLVSFILSKRKTFNDQDQPKADFIQYGNRLIEFFEKEKISAANQKFNCYLDMGINPSEAFNMTVGNIQ
jgi:putative flippase GtrA